MFNRQEDLTSSLIMNLGMEFLKWNKENTEKGNIKMQGKLVKHNM
jgi:hypothetical protein